MFKKIVNAVVVAGATAGITIAMSTPAQAATPVVQITKVYYNSPGSDTRTNTSLNAEYVRLTNRLGYAVNLKYWTLRDLSGHVYTFSSDFRLASGASVYVHTGKGTNTSTHRYWGSGAYIWNNTGDKAILRSSGGTTVDTCSWGGSGSYTYC